MKQGTMHVGHSDVRMHVCQLTLRGVKLVLEGLEYGVRVRLRNL